MKPNWPRFKVKVYSADGEMRDVRRSLTRGQTMKLKRKVEARGSKARVLQER